MNNQNTVVNTEPTAEPTTPTASTPATPPRFLSPWPTHRNNPFSQLSDADRNQLLHWCDEHPYEDVAERAALPRAEGGLDFQTSEAALSRFYTKHHRTGAALDALTDFTEHFFVDDVVPGDRFLTALSTLLEMSLFKAMVEPGADYQQHLKGLRTALHLRRALEPGRKLVQQQQIHEADVLINRMRQHEAAQKAAASASGGTDVSSVPAGVSPAGAAARTAPSRRPIPMPDAPPTPPSGAPPSSRPVPPPTIPPGLLTRALDEITRLQPTTPFGAPPSSGPLPAALRQARPNMESAPAPSTNSTKTPRNFTYSTPATAKPVAPVTVPTPPPLPAAA